MTKLRAAAVIPIRAGTSTVYKNRATLARVFDDLIKKDVDIISVSLGGPPGRFLHAQIERAHKAGIIIVSAAGNGDAKTLAPAGAPAIYPEVIAAGAVRADCKMWDKSARAFEVDVLAPGDNVWYPATYVTHDASGKPEGLIWSVRRGGGTSFATPYVAGLAALWIQANGGRAALRERYAKGADVSLLPKAFEVALKEYGLKVPMSHPLYSKLYRDTGSCTGYDENLPEKTGVGIVDARNLVMAPLPAADLVTERWQARVSGWANAAKLASGAADDVIFNAFERSFLSGLLTDEDRKKYFSTAQQMRAVVLDYLEYKYFGSDGVDSVTDEAHAEEDDQNALDTSNASSMLARVFEETCRAAEIQKQKFICDLDPELESGFPKEILDKIDPRDAKYFFEAYKYAGSAQDARDGLTDLLAGVQSWREKFE